MEYGDDCLIWGRRIIKIYSGLPLREALNTQSRFWSKVHDRAIKLRDNGKS